MVLSMSIQQIISVDMAYLPDDQSVGWRRRLGRLRRRIERRSARPEAAGADGEPARPDPLRRPDRDTLEVRTGSDGRRGSWYSAGVGLGRRRLKRICLED